MPSYFMLTGEYLEAGSGTPGQQGRASGNLNKIVYDSNGFLYVLKSNGDAASRVAFAPTMLDLTNTDSRDQVCIQPAASRLQMWAGLWAASVQNSTATNDTDLQWVLFRGSASAAPLESGAAHAANDTTAPFICNAGADNLASETFNWTASNAVDLTNGKFAFPAAGNVASNAETANVWLNLGLQ